MTKILQILPTLDSINGGVERGTLDVAKELIERGFESEIISSGGMMSEKYKYKGVNHHQIQLKKNSIKSLLKLTKNINQNLKSIIEFLVKLF